MYVPKQYANNDPKALKTFIQENSFATLVAQVDQKLWATHIPLEISADEKKLSGHISRANHQWKGFDNTEVLAIFQGPHTYISSSWYDHENVPTWNYIAVHVYGQVKIIAGEELMQSLKTLVDKYEKHSAHPVSVETMSADYIAKAVKGIVAFEITITKMESAFKLSQNRDDKNHQSIVQHLEQSNDPGAVKIADAMKKDRNSKPSNIV